MSEFSRAAVDAALVRHLDGETADGSDRDETVATAHADRLAELRLLSEQFRSTIAVLEIPPLPPLRSARTPRRSLAAAMALIVVAGAAAAMPGMRGFIADSANRLLDRVGRNGSAAAPAVAPTGGTATVAVPWTRAEFRVEIDRHQTAGRLRVERGTAAEIAVVARDAELIVLPDRLLVRTTAAATGDIVVTVPPGLERLRVSIAGSGRVFDLRQGLPAPADLAAPGSRTGS